MESPPSPQEGQTAMPERGRASRWDRLGIPALVAIGVAALLVAVAGPEGWAGALLITASAALVLLRTTLLPDQRVAWGLIAVALTLWSVGSIYSQLALGDDPSIPHPSLTDGCLLASFAALIGAVRLMGGKVRDSKPLSLGLAVTLLGLASAWSWLVFGGVADVADPSIAVAFAYPFLDVVLVFSVLIAVAARRWRIDPGLGAILAGSVLLLLADVVNAAWVASEGPVAGAALEAFRPLGAVAIATAAWTRPGAPAAGNGISGEKLIPILMSTAALLATSILVWDHFSSRSDVTIVLATITLVAAIAEILLLNRRTRRADEQSREAERLRCASIDAALDGVVTIDAGGIIREWNNAAQRSFGYSAAEAIGRDLSELIVPPARSDRHKSDVGRLAASGDPASVLDHRREVTGIDAQGRRFPLEVAVTRIREDPPMFTAFCHDISKRRRQQAEVESLAAIVRSSADAIVSLDLEGVVTAWNQGAEQLYGYSAEEAVGASLENLIIPDDRSSELEQMHNEVAAGRTMAFTTRRQTKDGRELDVSLRVFPLRDETSAVVGLAVSAHDMTDQLRREEQDRQDTEGRRWRRRIQEALAHDRLSFWAQPVVHIGSGKLDHCELLLRMQFEGRTISPGLFLPHAERSELIADIDRWALARGAELAVGARVAINLSARSLSNPRFIDRVQEELKRTGTRADSIIFEITETAAVENLGAAQALVEQLRTLGCGVALDDFGTGYGSFTYLKHLAVTELKIDMSFVSGLRRDPADRRVVESIIMVSKNFGITTVAEGVEDAETLEILTEMEVDLAQGYHLGRPSPAPMAGWPQLGAGSSAFDHALPE